jgi:hypothetical protein
MSLRLTPDPAVRAGRPAALPLQPRTLGASADEDTVGEADPLSAWELVCNEAIANARRHERRGGALQRGRAGAEG